MRALATLVHAILDRRLAGNSAAPLAIGLSGGGDSHALTLMAASWAREHGRRLVVLTVDHKLRPESRAWTQACGALACRLGLEFHPLEWTGDKPAQGLPAAARAARHGLLADAARRLGARVILLGHTASDLDEAAAMRAEGSTTPSPREWAPSPAWPQGRGVFLLRPMLALGRAELRVWLSAQGETWIEDPSNSDLRFARARARAGSPQPAQASAELSASLGDLARTVAADAAGVLSIRRDALATQQAPRLIAAASLCAAGTDRTPRRDRLFRLSAALRDGVAVTATLCGARIEADALEARFMREPGEMARAALADLDLHGSGVWDGRFEITSSRPVRIVGLSGRAASLPADQREALRRLPPRARAGLPAIIEEGGAVMSPVLGPVDGVTVRPLALDRLLAACGAIDREP